MNGWSEDEFTRLLTGLSPPEFINIMGGLMENPHMGIVIIDREGIVTVINSTYLDILGLKREEALGRHIYEITPESKLPHIVETGEVDVADFWSVNGHDMIVTRMPIAKGNCIIGAVGKTIFLDASNARQLLTQLNHMEKELKIFKQEAARHYVARWTFADIVGENPRIVKAKEIARQLANTRSTVLILGESGTGKELFAHAIHNDSKRRNGPFVRINCSAIPENLLEAELFGYEEGAFTGARKGGKPGKFELAQHGTIFLDEIGDMPLSMQTKLLTVLQDRELERVGGTRPIPIDVRVIAATNADLQEKIRAKQFREDLYYRLNVAILHLPPLAKHPDDIPLLARHIVGRINQRLETDVASISPEALQVLSAHSWPGNIRELENLLERAVNLASMHGDTVLLPRHFPSLLKQQGQTAAQMLPAAIESLEKELITSALSLTQGNRTQAAKMLGIHSSALYRKLNKYGLV